MLGQIDENVKNCPSSVIYQLMPNNEVHRNTKLYKFHEILTVSKVDFHFSIKEKRFIFLERKVLPIFNFLLTSKSQRRIFLIDNSENEGNSISLLNLIH